MSSLGKIYTYPNNWRVKRVQAVAALVGASVEEVHIEMAKTKEAEFLKKFPVGCVPAFEGADGVCLTESAAIAQYVAAKSQSKLIPTDEKAAAEHTQWVAFADQEIAGPLGLCSGMIAGYIPYNKPVYTTMITKIQGRLNALNTVLNTRTFLVGDRLTVADILLASVLLFGFSGLLDAPIRANVPNVVRYFETVAKNSKVAPAFGEVKYSETAPQYQAPKKESAPKPAKEAAAAAAPKPKAAKPADEEEEEPLVPAEPKAKNPLDSLPKSTFVLDEWKRVYSNEDTKKAIQWFYENFDKEGFSVWRADFKYNDELTQVFMSSNLIGGLFARLEASRKYCFASMGVFGAANDSLISGAFIVRGKEIEPVVSVAPDWESYTFRPLDLTNEEDKAFFEGALLWELSVNGKAFADGKIFK